MEADNQESEYYERFWKRETEGKNIFHGLPDWRQNLEKREEFFREIIKGKILDAGCGTGHFSINIARSVDVSEVYGIDLSKTAVEGCIKKAKESNLSTKVKFKSGSVTDLPFQNKIFDSIFAFEIVEHIVDTEKMFKEFNRVLRKGGYLGITTVDFNLLKRIVISIFYFEIYFDPMTPHIRFFNKNTLERILERTGFRIIKYKWDGSYLGIMPKGQAVIAQKYKDI